MLTPDAARPAAVDAVDDRRVVWFNFAALHDAITAVVDDVYLAPSERDRFLLRELQALFDNDGLLTSDEVGVVAASHAYPAYLQSSAYICQAGRAFREGLTHMGFYAQQAVQPHLVRILTREDHVPFTYEEAQRREANGGRDARIGELIRASLDAGVQEEGQEYMVFLLSGPQDPETVGWKRRWSMTRWPPPAARGRGRWASGTCPWPLCAGPGYAPPATWKPPDRAHHGRARSPRGVSSERTGASRSRPGGEGLPRYGDQPGVQRSPTCTAGAGQGADERVLIE